MKGPTAKIMQELGIETTALAIARHYSGLIDGLLVDDRDAAVELAGSRAEDFARLGIAVGTARTLMRTLEDREQLGRAALDFASRLSHRPKSLVSGA